MEVARISANEIEMAATMDMTPTEYVLHREDTRAITEIADAFMRHRRGKEVTDRDWNAAEAVLLALRELDWRNRLT